MKNTASSTWDAKFTKRDELLYRAENQRAALFPDQPRIDTFLNQRVHRLMPVQYSYDTLRDFLHRDGEAVQKLEGTSRLIPGSTDMKETILLDERRDPSPLNAFASRYWAQYAQYPPRGESERLEVLTPKALHDRLQEDRFEGGENSPERRSIYITDLSPLCALSIILPVASRYLPSLREFLSKYIAGRVFFGISIDYPIRPASIYAFEFHIPYFALRRSTASVDSFRNHADRRTGEFQSSFSTCQGNEKEYFHEAQVSVILVGIDEWVWTLYCLVETHFSETGPENLAEYIHDDDEAPSGGKVAYSSPIWNPREYFLLVLSQRMSQVKFEWRNLVETLDRRLRYLEEDTFRRPVGRSTTSEDADLKLTHDYTWAIEVLQLFSNQLIKTTEAWDEFSEKHLHILQPEDTPVNFLPKISSYLECLERDVSELRFLYRTLVQRIGAFDSKRANILDTSALVEARASNSQADNIGLLTKVTVFYLPLGLVTAIFSMAFIPSSISGGVYAAVLVPFTILSVLVSFNLAPLLRVLKEGSMKRSKFTFMNIV